MKADHNHLYFQLELERCTTMSTLARCTSSQNPLEQDYRQKLTVRLNRIEQAIMRYAEDRYGICQSCQRPINVERLEALPYCELCIDCQRQLEKQTVRAGAIFS